jgi:hypothetical protein
VELYTALINNPKTRIYAKKNSLALDLSKNVSIKILEKDTGFINVFNKNSQNINIKTREKKLSIGNNKGIVSGGGGLGNVDIIDDGDLQAVLNPQIFQE